MRGIFALIRQEEQSLKKELEDLILYVLGYEENPFKSRKWLQKIIFLIQYYDPQTGKITLEDKPLKDLQYIMYNYGPFSFEVHEVMIDLLRKKEIEEDIVEHILIPTKRRGLLQIRGDLKKKADSILKLFGKKSGKELEKITLELLGIPEYEKDEYLGMTIEEVIQSKKVGS